MPIPKKKVVKKEDYIEKNHSTNITDDDFLDLSIPLDDDEDLDIIRKSKIENNDTKLKKDENIDLDLNSEDDENTELIRQHQTADNNTEFKNNTDDNSDLSLGENKKTNNINTIQQKNNNIIRERDIGTGFKKIIDYETPEEFISKINTPEYTFCGYKLTSLADGEVFFLEKLGLNEDNISNYCLAKNVFLDYMQGYDEDFKFKKQWGFPYSGNYIGYILNCNPSDFRNGEYYVEFLANNFDVCLFRFSTSFRDTVNNCIKRQLGWTNNIFKQSDYTALKGFLVYISVENVRLENGKTFSNITNFKVIDDDIAKLLDKLVNDMSR